MAFSTTTQDMKLAIVALGLGKESLIMMNCAANLVVDDPTLLFQTELVRAKDDLFFFLFDHNRIQPIYGRLRQHTILSRKISKDDPEYH